MLSWLQIAISFLITAILSFPAHAGHKHGYFSISFDDGYTSWHIAAKILKKYDGFATGYVNDYRIEQGIISAQFLLTLQNDYGWEIGTHTYSHANAEIYVVLYNKDKWIEDELIRSIMNLRSFGLNVNSIAFPFNKAPTNLLLEVRKYLSSFRVDDENPIGKGIHADGSFSSKAIDLSLFVPLEQIKRWVDKVHQNGEVLLLHGHQVLPDDAFRSGVIASLTKTELLATEAIPPLVASNLCLVPNISKPLRHPIYIKTIEGNRISIVNGSLLSLASPGVKFLLGPCMAIRESDFEALISYVAERLKFRRISDLPRIQ